MRTSGWWHDRLGGDLLGLREYFGFWIQSLIDLNDDRAVREQLRRQHDGSPGQALGAIGRLQPDQRRVQLIEICRRAGRGAEDVVNLLRREPSVAVDFKVAHVVNRPHPHRKLYRPGLGGGGMRPLEHANLNDAGGERLLGQPDRDLGVTAFAIGGLQAREGAADFRKLDGRAHGIIGEPIHLRLAENRTAADFVATNLETRRDRHIAARRRNDRALTLGGDQKRGNINECESPNQHLIVG
ncbi:MAG: hypothetical protein V9H26_20685 [Verrucomicrobiota bacterium]